MTGRLQGLQPHTAKFQNASVTQRREGVPRFGFGAQVNRSTLVITQLQMPGHKVRMKMSQDDVLDPQAVFGGEDEILRYVTLRIDDRGGGRCFVADKVRSVRQAIQVELFEDHCARPSLFFEI